MKRDSKQGVSVPAVTTANTEGKMEILPALDEKSVVLGVDLSLGDNAGEIVSIRQQFTIPYIKEPLFAPTGPQYISQVLNSLCMEVFTAKVRQYFMNLVKENNAGMKPAFNDAKTVIGVHTPDDARIERETFADGEEELEVGASSGEGEMNLQPE